jgi:hypothetical protein
MSNVQLIALKPHRYSAKPIAVGDKYEATAAHARVLKAVKLAADASPSSSPKPKRAAKLAEPT